MKSVVYSAVAASLLGNLAWAQFTIDTEVGGSFSHGNSKDRSFIGTADMRYQLKRFQHDIGFELFRSESAEVVTSDRTTIEYQGRISFLQQGYAFGIVELERDPPADVRQRVTGIAGLGRVLSSNRTSDWEAELGYGTKTTALFSDTSTQEEPVTYLALKGMQHLTETVKLKFKLSSKVASDNVATKGQFSVQTSLGERTALSVGYKIRHNTEITGSLGEKFDGVLSVTLSQRLK